MHYKMMGSELIIATKKWNLNESISLGSEATRKKKKKANQTLGMIRKEIERKPKMLPLLSTAVVHPHLK